MADDFGLRIGVDGEKEFKSAIADINREFKVLGSEMALATSQFDKNDKSVAAVTSRNEVLSKQIDAQKDKISTLKSALDNASSSFGENDRRTQNWQIQLNKAEAELNGMERELQNNDKALQDVGDEMTDTAKDADKLADETDDAGDKADDAGSRFEKLGGILKGVGATMGVAFAAVGTAAVTATKSLANMSVGSAAYADDILTAASVTGISTDKLQAYKYAAELVDVSVDTMTGSMAKNIKSMTSATDASKGTGAAYAALGVNVRDSNGNLRDGETVYWETIDALGKVKDETQRDSLAMQILGKSAQQLNPLIDQGSAGMQTFAQQAKDAGAVLSGETLDSFGNFDDNIQILTSNSNAAKTALGSILMPALNSLAVDGAGLIAEFTKGLNAAGGDTQKISEVVSSTITGLVTVIQEELPQMLQMGIDLLSALFNGIAGALPTLFPAVSMILTTLIDGITGLLDTLIPVAISLIMALVQGLIKNLPKLIEAAIQIIISLVNGITQALPKLIPAVVQAIITIVKSLIDNLPMILEAALQLILALAQGLLAAIPQLIEALPAIINGIIDFVIGAIPQIIEAGIELLVSLVEALPTIIEAIVKAIPQIIDGLIKAIVKAIPLLVDAGIKLLVSLIQNLPTIIITIVNAIPKIISSLIEGILGAIPQLVQAGITLFISLIKNLPTIIIEIVKAVPKIITGLVNGFTESFGKIAEVGKNLIEGLWNGIKDMGKWILDKIKGFGAGILDGIKGFFGIKSPSRVFRDQIGKNLALGLGAGFEDEMGNVTKDMQNAVPTDFDIAANVREGAMPVSPMSHYGGGVYPAASGTIIHQKVAITSPKALSEREAAREFNLLSRKLAMGV